MPSIPGLETCDRPTGMFAASDGARGSGGLISDDCAAMTASPERIGVAAENAGTLGQIRFVAGKRPAKLHNGQESREVPYTGLVALAFAAAGREHSNRQICK